MKQTENQDQAIGLKPIVAYSMPGLAFSAIGAPITVLLPGLYAKYAGVSLAAIGTIFLLMRVFDAVTDPLIGHFSDKTRSPIGARKPWVIAGGLLTMVSVLFLFQIPTNATALYFGIWCLVYYLGSTMYQIPHLAWGKELTWDYKSRAKVFGVKSMFETGGALSYSLIPLLLVFFGLAADSSYNRESVMTIGIFAAILIPLSILYACYFAPSGPVRESTDLRFRDTLKAALNNLPLRRFLSAHVVSSIATGFTAALMFPFLDRYLDISSQIPLLLLAANIGSMTALPLWVKLSGVLGKHKVWAIAAVIQGLAFMPFLFVESEALILFTAFASFTIYGMAAIAPAVASMSLLADIADYEQLKTGEDRSGSYYALLFLIVKMAASAGGISLIILGSVFGFEMSSGVQNTELAQFGIRLLFCVTPIILYAPVFLLMWKFPINIEKYNIIHRRLAQRAERLEKASNSHPDVVQ